MLLMGDEMGRSQLGNNNAYCHDSSLAWLDWTLKERHADLFRFARLLIAFRKRHPALRHPLHAGVPGADSSRLDVVWHGVRPAEPDFADSSRTLAFELRHRSAAAADVVYVAASMYWEPLPFELPPPPSGQRWHRFVDTACEPPAEIHAPGEEPPVEDRRRTLVGPRSVQVLVARRPDRSSPPRRPRR
jgi:glycogen operon protein